MLGLALAAGLAAAVVAVVWLLQPPSEIATGEASAPLAPASAAEQAPTQPEPLAAPQLSRLDVDTVLARAKARALTWHGDALLCEFEVQNVIGGRLDARDSGSWRARFGKPAEQRLGPGTPVQSSQFQVRISGGEVSVGPIEGSPGIGLADPACAFREMWRTMVASGVPANASVDAQYVLEPSRGGAVWHVEVAGKPRLSRRIDGKSCAVITRPPRW